MTRLDTQVPGLRADSLQREQQESVVSARVKGTEGGTVQGAGRSRAPDHITPATPASTAGGQSAADEISSVHITGAAHQMLALQQQIADASEVDVAKVEQVRNDIQQNRYRVDPARIADRLLQLEGSLPATASDDKA